jgi:uncharacterized protein (UPF0262 family)
MAAATLSELRIDETTWAAGSIARRHEWRVAISEVVIEGRFEAPADETGALRGMLRLDGDRDVTLEVHGADGLVDVRRLPVDELRPLMDEYMQICEQMGKGGVGANSPKLEALDIAKRLTHDEAGEALRAALPVVQPDHSTARRLFTLLVTLLYDTTRLAAPPHPVRS